MSELLDTLDLNRLRAGEERALNPENQPLFDEIERLRRERKRPWMPTAEQPNFDQYALRSEINKVWGEHGAHSEVYRMLLRDAARYWWFRDHMDESKKLHMIAAGTDYYDSDIDADRSRNK